MEIPRNLKWRSTVRANLENELAKQISLSDVTIETDAKFGLPDGTSLSLAYHFIARRIWVVDMFKEINPSHPLELLKMDEQRAIRELEA